MSWFSNLLENLIDKMLSGFIGFLIGVLLMYLYRKLFELWRKRRLASLFGSKSGKFYIVHSVVYDNDRKAYEYPACDTTASRYLGSIFSQCGCVEDKDYFICPDISCKDENKIFKDEILHENLVCICSPKRNTLTDEILQRSNFLRYNFKYSEKHNHQIIVNTTASGIEYVSSRDEVRNQRSSFRQTTGYDFAYIASFPNPFNHERRVLLIFGIHGTGTQGAAKFLLEDKNRLKVEKNIDRGVAEIIIKAEYAGEYENITRTLAV